MGGMETSMRRVVAVLSLGILMGCSADATPGKEPASAVPLESAAPAAAPSGAPRSRTVRLSGILEAVRSTRVVVPQITGPTFQMTLTRLVPNGSVVKKGDIIAEFDPLEQLDQARQSAARYDDLSFQVRQKAADNVAATERRRSERQQAEADLEKALLEVSKAPVLSRADATKNTLLAAKAKAQLESLTRRHPDEERADKAALRVLELQRDRQKAAYERARANLEKLRLRAPLGGMVAHATRYSNGAMVRPQEGDRLNRNNTIMSIFDPGEMLVRVSVAEPDGALLHPGLEAKVHVDAFPDIALRAHFVTASPVAAAPIFSEGVKSFRAVFRLYETDARLTPDLSAAVVFETSEAGPDTRERSVVAAAGDGR
jgi:HlyD family secretion protein